MFIIKFLSVVSIITVHCAAQGARAIGNISGIDLLSVNQDNKCPLLFHYDNETEKCECLGSLFHAIEPVVTCDSGRAMLSYNFCVTYKEEISTISLAFCPYFELNGHNISEPGFITLPENISELNNYMCGPMNRKGLVCSECIDGYGPSVTSPKFICSNCSNAWYSVPIYLLLELGPVTVFFLIVLIFQFNLTSAPMISFIFYSNIVLANLNFNAVNIDGSKGFGTILALSYGIWTLDFFRYTIPPFCILPNLKIFHIVFLQSVSTIFSFVLIGITWICIKLHSRDYKIVTWPWRLVNSVIIKCIKVKWNSGRTVVDAFATFFVLSFSKVTLTLLSLLFPLKIQSLNNTDLSLSVTISSLTDPNGDYASKERLPFVAFFILMFFIIISPVLLLALYPIQAFRSVLLKCLPKRSIGPLNIFIEKFYCCYRDSLDGGKDMRSLASFYFFIPLLCSILWSIESAHFLITTLFGASSLLIAYIQPYKKKYMSILDSIILANMALIVAALDRNIYDSHLFQIITVFLVLLPAIGMLSFVVYKLFNKPLKEAFIKIRQNLLQAKLRWCCSGHKDDGVKDEEQGNIDEGADVVIQLPDRIVHPELYEQITY